MVRQAPMQFVVKDLAIIDPILSLTLSCTLLLSATQTYNSRSIFHNQDTQPLGNTGLELWRGFFQ